MEELTKFKNEVIKVINDISNQVKSIKNVDGAYVQGAVRMGKEIIKFMNTKEFEITKTDKIKEKEDLLKNLPDDLD